MTVTESQLRDVLETVTPGTAAHHMLRAMLYNLHHWPRCASCGDTNNLTEVIATPEGTYHLCPEHLAEERER